MIKHNLKDFRPIMLNKVPVMTNSKHTVACYDWWDDLHESTHNTFKEVRDCKLVYQEYIGIPCSLEELWDSYPSIERVVGDMEAFYQEVSNNKVLFHTLNYPIAIEYSEHRIYLIAPSVFISQLGKK